MNKIHLLCLIIFCNLICGCSKYGYVNLNFPLEPQMYLPEDVNNIAVVNRSLTSEEDNKTRIAEAIGTAEIAGSDRAASEQCLTGVFNGLNGYKGVSIIFPKETHLYGTGTREIPDPLEWEQVEGICKSSNADVLLALETFDSNSDLVFAAAVEQATSMILTGKPKQTPPNQVRMSVACYWRMYDPVSRKIIDQYHHTSFLTFNLNGGVPPLDALPETAYKAGRDFSARYLPGYYTERRDMYKKGKGKAKKRFEAAFRKTEVANWEGAIEIWEELVENVKRKTAGRSCLNIAVGYEVLGNTDLAIEWAKKSYEEYNDKLGKDYTNVLIRRKSLEN